MARLLTEVLLVLLWLLHPGAAGASASTTPTIAVTIDGSDVTSQLMAASWNLGINDFLADLAPNTASLSFKGQLSVSPADAVVISADGSAMWTGRLDSYVETRDVNGDYWSSVSATDVIGAMGAAELVEYSLSGVSVTLRDEMETIFTAAGVALAVYDDSSTGLIDPDSGGEIDPFSGPALEYLAHLADFSNAMVALQHDGSISIWTREAFSSGYVTNGTFETNTSGWSDFNTGTITRITSDSHSGSACAQIVSGTGYGGATHAFTGRMVKGHTYRISFWAKVTAGSGGWYAATFASTPANATFSPTSSWAQYTFDVTPTSTALSDTLAIRDTDTTTGTLLVDDVTITEVANATDISASIVTWEKTTSIDVDINKWLHLTQAGGGNFQTSTMGSDASDISTYGERIFDARWFDGGGDTTRFDDWIALGGSQRPIVTRGELVVASADDPLLALDPLDWVNDGTDDWQIMSMSWSAAPGEPWRLTITADNLIALL